MSKPTFIRRFRGRTTSPAENSFFKKEGIREHTLFGDSPNKTFFQPGTFVQRKCEKCQEDDAKIHRLTDKKEEEKKLQRKESNISSNAAIGSYISGLSGGQKLPGDVSNFYTSRMGHDFSNVKIHTGNEATTSAEELNARAYTVGRHIVFNEGQYNPSSHAGKELLAHELTHIVQQESGKQIIARQKTVAQTKGIDTDDPVNKKMPAAIDLMFAASPLLTKFFPKGIKKIDSKGKFQIKIGYANLKAAYKECYGNELSEDTTIGGFYCRKTDTIYTVAGFGKEKSSTFGEAMHEAIHKISASAYVLGSSFIDEGVTQYFADLIMAEQKMNKYTGHQYKDQLECAANIATLVGDDMLAEEFFQKKNSVEKKLNEIFKTKLAKDKFPSVRVYVAKDKKKFCEMLKAKK
jgi:hypothetical protein